MGENSTAGLLGSPAGIVSSSALGAVVCTHGGKLGIRLGHESLQLLLKELVRGLGRGGGHGCALGSGLLGGGGILAAGLPALLGCAALAEIVPGGCISLGLGLQTLDGKVDLAVFRADDHHLHILTLGQVLADIADIGIGYFGNMYKAGLILRQGNECAEIGDGLYLAFQNGSDG